MKKVKVFAVKNNELIETEIIDDWKVIVNFINCSLFDVVSRNIEGEDYDIYCDDMGLYKHELKPSMLTIDDDEVVVEQIVGNIIIARHTQSGEMKSLTETDKKKIIANVKRYGIVVARI